MECSTGILFNVVFLRGKVQFLGLASDPWPCMGSAPSPIAAQPPNPKYPPQIYLLTPISTPIPKKLLCWMNIKHSLAVSFDAHRDITRKQVRSWCGRYDETIDPAPGGVWSRANQGRRRLLRNGPAMYIVQKGSRKGMFGNLPREKNLDSPRF